MIKKNLSKGKEERVLITRKQTDHNWMPHWP